MPNIQDSEVFVEKTDSSTPHSHTSHTSLSGRTTKLSARERIRFLLDPESFREIGNLVTPFLDKKKENLESTDGVITGLGTINNRPVALYAQDFSMRGGSVGRHHGEKIARIHEKAAMLGIPVIGLIDSGGARINEGIHALASYGKIFSANVALSGVVPQISVILGPCAGGAVYSPALTDLIFAVENISQLFITGPQVVARALGGPVIDKNELGGTVPHSTKSGVLHYVAPDELSCFAAVRAVLEYLPSNFRESAPMQDEARNLCADRRPDAFSLPASRTESYDMHELVESVVDHESFFELQELFAPQVITGFARLEGRSVGIIANNPLHMAGALESNSACKAGRFITLCESFSIPVVTFVDTPGYLPGIEQEHGGIIRHGAKMIAAYADATVPLVTIIVRKAYGGAYIVMGSSHLGADAVAAWPTAEIAVLGSESAVEILHGKKLAQLSPEERVRERARLEQEYHTEFIHPYVAAENGYIDTVIEPTQTRTYIIDQLRFLESKVKIRRQKSLRNIPQ